MAQFVVRFTYKGEKVKENFIRVNRFLDRGDTTELYIDSKIPQMPFDSVMVFVANDQTMLPIVVDNVKIYSFNQ